MSLDPFEARLQFLGLLRKLSASQQSIQTVVSYALKYGRKCGEDLWDCIVEECGKGSLNTRINILYFLDTLCDPQTTSTLIPSASSSSTTDFPYTALLNRDVEKLVGLVVPDNKEGILNLLSTKQIVESFRNKRTIPVEVCDELVEKLEQRRTAQVVISFSLPASTYLAELQGRTFAFSSHHSVPPALDPTNPITTTSTSTSTPNSKKRPHPSSLTNFSRNDTLRRMEEDRERHKRLREGMWVLPIPGVGSVLPINTNGADRPVAGGVSKLRAGAGVGQTIGSNYNTGTGNGTALAGSAISSLNTSPASPSDNASSNTNPSKGKPDSQQPQQQPQVLAEHVLVDPVDVEFEQLWETMSDFDDEDREDIMQENRIFARTRGRELPGQDRGYNVMDVDVPVHLVA